MREGRGGEILDEGREKGKKEEPYEAADFRLTQPQAERLTRQPRLSTGCIDFLRTQLFW